jgi:hypothetical protein
MRASGVGRCGSIQCLRREMFLQQRQFEAAPLAVAEPATCGLFG